MSLVYKFKKEKLKDGGYVSRPRIFITLSGNNSSLDVPALIDSGCDTNVIPESIAKIIGLDINGEKIRLYAYRESCDVIKSKADIIFWGKVQRQSIRLKDIPILITPQKDINDDEDVILGINGIFDSFEILFNKSQNRIILKSVDNTKSYFKS